jgi:hypothetical protein
MTEIKRFCLLLLAKHGGDPESSTWKYDMML